jgi:hypothetical protein
LDPENVKDPGISPVIVGEKVENASGRLTSELSRLSDEFQDLPVKLDNSFEFILKKQTSAVNDMKDSYEILNSLRNRALIIVGAVAVTQLVADVLTLKLISSDKIFIFANVLAFIPYGFLAYNFFTNTKWKTLRGNSERIKDSITDVGSLHSKMFGSELQNNAFSIFSEFKGRVIAGIKSVVEASITFSSLGRLYRESLEYLKDLQTFKESLKRALIRYNLELPNALEKYIQEFNGDHLPSSLWIDRIAEQVDVCKLIDPLIFKLFYFEAVNIEDENTNLLNQLKKQGSIKPLVNYLIFNETITIKFEYPEEWVSKIMTDAIAEMDAFSLSKLKLKLENKMNMLQSYINRFSRFLDAFEIDYPEIVSRDFIPESILNFENEYLNFLSSRIGASRETIKLLYYSTWNEEITRNCFKGILEDEVALIGLSRFLLKHNFKTLNFSEENFSRIIASLQEFNLGELTRRGSSLEKIIAFEGQYLEYLKNNNFPYQIKQLQFNNELLRLAFEPESKVLDKYIKFSQKMVVTPEKIQDKNIFHTILLLIFFNEVSSPEAATVNKQVLEMKDALLALYKFINISQESLPENRLSTISDAVKFRDANDEKDPVYSEFVSRLLQGQFIRYLPSLMSPMMKQIMTDYKKIQSKENYPKIDLIMAKIFKKRIGREQILRMLSGNLIESYLVTVPSKGSGTVPVISTISDSVELIEAEREIAIGERDESFNNLIKVTSAGTYTRIGIIPENMTFSDFSSKFEKVVRAALRKRHHSDYPVYLTKVSASSQMTSVIMDTQGNEISPYIAIRNLAEEVLPKEKLAALYAITNIRKLGKIGISDLVAAIIDSDYGGIMNVIPNIPEDSILSRNDAMAEETKKKINIYLCEQFSAGSTTELCLKIYSQISGLGKNAVLKSIEEGLRSQGIMPERENKNIRDIVKEILDVSLSISSIL